MSFYKRLSNHFSSNDSCCLQSINDDVEAVKLEAALWMNLKIWHKTHIPNNNGPPAVASPVLPPSYSSHSLESMSFNAAIRSVGKRLLSL
eukprot:1918863-Amphidinium_carterae.1